MKTLALLLVLAAAFPVFAKKTLVFDENQGIIWVDDAKKNEKKAFDMPEVRKKTVIVEEKTVRIRQHVKTKPLTATDIRETGTKFYFNSDYAEALKYFERAWEAEQDPTDYFWMGACQRKLEQTGEMTRIFAEIIEKYPHHGVADDALFYLAVSAQHDNDYETAYGRYRDVVELYPEGTSLIGKFDFREEAKKQMRGMKVDLLSRLKLIGYSDNNLQDLLKTFQTDNKLEPTGKPHRATVALLVSLSDDRESRMKGSVAAAETFFNKQIVYYGFICALLLLNILWGFRNLRATADEAFRAEQLLRELQ